MDNGDFIKMEEQALMEYFKFDDADLAVNRVGSLTEKQKVRLTAELKSAGRGRMFLSLFMFLIALVGVGIAVFVWFVPDSGWGMRIGFAFGFGLLWPALYGLMGFAFWPSDKYSSIELDHVTGRVNIVRVEHRSGTTNGTTSRYDLYIGSRRLLADHKVGGVMVNGDEYTVYFLKYSNKIVSAELISR